jgi:DNA-binding MarR family transcriptional regulator
MESTAAEITLRDDACMLAWRAFIQAHSALISVLERELEAERGLPLSQYEVLLRLDLAPEHRMRMQDLAGSILLSKSGVTRLVDRMADAGLVERAACESDRRVTYAAITDKGHGVLAGAAPTHLKGVEEHFSRFLSEEEAKVVSTALLKVFRHAAEELKADDGPSPD